MMRSLFCALLLALATAALAQNPTLNAAEYFWDTDPGQGSGTPLSIPTGTTAYRSASINVNTLSIGAHTLYVRFRTAASIWSSPEGLSVYISSPGGPQTLLSNGEYFFDTDPGQGSGTPLTVSPGLTAYRISSASVNVLSVSTHNLMVRWHTAGGRWSAPEALPFYVSPPLGPRSPLITSAEYFFDTDPGQGSGTSLTVSPGLAAYRIASASVNALSVSTHNLMVRWHTAAGRWSAPEALPFYVSPPLGPPSPPITSAEYFFDTDPGQGSGTPFLLTPTARPYLVRGVAVAALSQGSHLLKTRFRDSALRWSMPEGLTMFVAPPAQDNTTTIAEAMVWFDSLGAPGTGMDLFPDDGAFDHYIESAHRTRPGAIFSNGLHHVYARVRDSRSFWSIVRTDSFFNQAALSMAMVANASVAGDSVQLWWNTFPEALQYRVVLDSVVTGPFASFFLVNAPDTTTVVPLVSSGMLRRYYRVSAILPDPAFVNREGSREPR